MGSAIGDYVHYYAGDYDRYGISKNFSTSSEDGDRIMQAYKTQKLNMIKKTKKQSINKKQIQEDLNMILSGEDTSNERIKEIQKYITNEINKEAIRYGAKGVNINYSTGQVTAQALESYILTAEAKLTDKIKRTEKFFRVSTLESRIKSIEENIKLISGETTQEQVKKQIESITKTLEDLKKDTGNTEKKIMVNNKALSLVDQINDIIQKFNAKKTINLLKGEFWEYVIALSPYIGAEYLGKSLDDFAANKMGDARSSKMIKLNNFAKDIDISKIFGVKGWTLDDGGQVALTTGKSQDKVDVELYIKEGKSISVSAKNVNLASGYDVHLVTNTSLLYLLQDEDPEYINHYLNIMATHCDDDGYITSLRQLATNTTKIILLYKALAGGFGVKKVELFILNNNSATNKDSIKIYEVADLIDYAAKNLNLIHATANDIDIDLMRFKNEFAIDYQTRITNLIADVHQKKISVALKADTFKANIS